MTILLPFAFGMPGPMELLMILGIGVLLFGKRLPEVGRSLGKSIVEFKKGIHGIEEEIDVATTASSTAAVDDQTDDRDEATAPKFDPPVSEPRAETAQN